MTAGAWWRWVNLPWLWVPAATLLVYATGIFWRFDLSIYDAALPSAPAPSDIVIVAVDDASIAQLGRWPWRRAIHAALLDRLRADGVRAVAFDVLFTEPDPGSPSGDAAFAAAMRLGPPTVLPLSIQIPGGGRPPRELAPIPMLAAAAAGLGHVDLEIDGDGIVRSVYLREGPGAATHPQLAVALLQAAQGARPEPLPGERRPDSAPSRDAVVRDDRVLIPYLGPPGHFTHYSYVDVLSGAVPRSALDGKIVLVGVTAQGFGDAFATPRSGLSRPMPGVEITANILQALRSHTVIRRTPLIATLLLDVLAVVVVAVALTYLGPRASLLLAASAWLGTLGASVLALRLLGWWWPPTAPLAVMLAAYPLWSWQRLEAAQAFLEEELTRLASEPFALPEPAPSAAAVPHAREFIQRRIDLVRAATRRQRALQRLLADTLNGLPDAMIVADAGGRIVLANPAAAALFGLAEPGMLPDRAVDDFLFARTRDEALRLDALAARAPCTAEVAWSDGRRHLLVRAVPFHVSAHERAGTIIDLADITELRAAQREREDVARFLSHDMKSPAASLLGLAQLQRDPARALPPPELSRRMELLAQRVLTLVDNFVALTRAESADPARFDAFDLRDAVQDAYDEVWAAAQARNITIRPRVLEETCTVNGDRHLLARAVVNLLANAVKFSPADAAVDLICERRGSDGVVTVADRGPGIDPRRMRWLFRRFSRGLHRGGTDPGGVGLGLAFVRVVAEKHGGRSWAENGRESGTLFSLSVPTCPELERA